MLKYIKLVDKKAQNLLYGTYEIKSKISKTYFDLAANTRIEQIR